MKKLGFLTIVLLLASLTSSVLSVNFYEISKLTYTPIYTYTKPIIITLNYMSLAFLFISLILAVILLCIRFKKENK